jgi:hypothetical protein
MTNRHCSDEEKAQLLDAVKRLGISQGKFIERFLAESRQKASLKSFDAYKKSFQQGRNLAAYDYRLMSEFLEVLSKNQPDRIYLAASPFLRELDSEAREEADSLSRKVAKIAKKSEPR